MKKNIYTTAFLLWSLSQMYAQNPFPTSGFTLPAGKSIVITYDVTVNPDACANNMIPLGNIANQSQVQGSNFTTVNTDDPDVSGASNHTVTPFGAITIGNMIYNDLDRNGLFDGSDVGLNLVSVNLYVDDGDGVLDAGDGAAIANTFTTNGLYSFTICPGTYIVEVAASNFNMGGALYNSGAPYVSSPIGGAPDPDSNTTDSDDNGDPVSGFGVATAAFTVAYNPNPAQTSEYNHIDLGFKTPTTVTINDVTLLNEGTGGGPTAFNFTVSRNDNSEAFSLTVNTSVGTATSGTDFTAISSGTVSFMAGGGADATVTVYVTHDNIVENNETFFVNLSGAPPGVFITDGTGDGVINNDDAATVTLSGPVSQPEGNASTTTYAVTLTLDNPVQGGFMITGDLTPITASFGSDISGPDVGFNFAGNAGETKTMNQTIFGDLTVELDETFTITLTNLTGAPAGVTAGSAFTGTITNDDQCVIAFVAPISTTEGNSGTTTYALTITKSNPVDVPYVIAFSHSDGTATFADNDFVNAVGNTSVGILSGSPLTIGNPPIINGDLKVEANEVFNVTLSENDFMGRNIVFAGGGPTLSNTVTIINNDNATVTLSPVGGVTQNEGNTGVTNFVFTATLDNPVQDGFSINYSTVDGTATSPSDYTGVSGGSLTFLGNALEAQNISIGVNGDLDIENDETFTVQLGTAAALTTVQTNAISTAGSPKTGTIVNDEKDWGDAPTAAQSGFAGTYPTLSTDNGASHDLAPGGLRLGATVDADLDGQPNADATGDGADEDGVTLPSAFALSTTANITVNASGNGKLNAWVDWNRDGDWSDTGEKVFNDEDVFTGNNTLPIAVPGTAAQGNTYVRFRLTTATGTGITGTASDGEAEDYQVSVVANNYSISSPTVTEGSAPGTVTLMYTISRLDNTNAGSVNYSAPTGTATAGSDYTTIPAGMINFTAGGGLSQDVSVTVNGDDIVEDNETVVITLSNPVNGGIGTGTGTGIITNDDIATLTLAGGTIQDEGNIGTTGFTFTATLNKAVQDGFKVAYTTTGVTATAGVDFTDNDGMLTFAGTIGETQSWTVDVNGDNTVELGETFEGALGAVTMTSAVQAAAISVSGSPKTDVITNDDAATVSIAANVSQAENLSPQQFSVTLSNPVDENVTVNFNTADNTATTGDNDYTGIVNQVVTFNAGTTTAQTVNVVVNNDNKVEANETYTVGIGTLSASGRNVSLGTSTRTGTITNNDAALVTFKPAGGVSQNEGNTGTTNFVFTAELDNPVQGGFTLAYATNDGTATTADNDYVDNDATLTFADNSTTPQNITVQVNGDNKVEANETFTVALGGISGTSLSGSITVVLVPRTGTIQNDEVDWGDAPDPTYPTLSANDGARHKTNFGVHLGAGIDGEINGQPNTNADGDDTDAEGDDDDGVTLPGALVINTTANITVNASTGGLLNAWVDFNQNGSWESPSEQIFTNTTLVSGNNALSFAVPPGATLGASYARFRFGNGNLAPTGLDNTGEVEDYKIEIVNTLFSIDNPMVTEGNSPGTSNLTFRISRNVNANDCSVKYTVTDGTATTADNDYNAGGTGIAIFSAGGALFQDITIISVNGDNKVELDETVLMTLSDPVGASIASGMGTGTGTITNDDQGVITISSPSIAEGDAGNSNLFFQLSLSNPSDANIFLNFMGVSNTAVVPSDFVGTAGSTSITAGATTGSFSIPVKGDCTIEPDETFFARLSFHNTNGRNIIFSGGGSTLDGTGTITNDDALPVITCGGNISQNAAAGQCSANVTLALPSTGSLCGSSTLEFRHRTVNNANVPTGAFSGYISSASNTQTFGVGRYEIEWRVTDGSGSNICNLYLDVIDNQPPSIVCPVNISRNTDFGLCTAVVSYALPTFSDNCSGASLMLLNGLASGSAFPKGVNMVEWKATDAAGLSSICQFTVTVLDAQTPVITCPANIVRNTDAGLCSAVVTYSTPTATDNCGAVTLTRTSPPNTANGSAFPGGATTVVTWQASDGASPSPNTATCSFTVTVNDAQLPNISCPSNITRNTDAGQCHAAVTYTPPTYSDNCTGGGAAIQSGLPSGSNFPKGINTVVWRATDAGGLTKTCSFRVTVNDTQAPTISCPTVAPTTTTPTSCVSAPVMYSTPTATDNCPGAITVVRLSGPASGSTFPLGMTNVVWRAIDGAGRSSTCSFSVAVTDATPPVVNCPSNIAVTGSGSPCTAVTGYATPTATDNCGVQSLFLLSGQPSGSTYPAGVTVNTWRAVDNGGNSATCSFTVTVGCGTSGQNNTQQSVAYIATDKPSTAGKGLSRFDLLLEIYPNPASSEVRFRVSGLEGQESELVVFDALGRTAIRQAISSEQREGSLDVSAWTEGFYQVVLRTEKERAVRRLIVIKE